MAVSTGMTITGWKIIADAGRCDKGKPAYWCECTGCGRDELVYVWQFGEKYQAGSRCYCFKQAEKKLAKESEPTPKATRTPEEDRARRAARGRAQTAKHSEVLAQVKARIWNDAEDKDDDMAARADLIGRTFGSLTVVTGYTTGSGKDTILECQCTKCGRERPAYFTRDQLLRGSVSQCFDCMEKPKPKPKSVLVSDSPDWRLYQSLRGRCDNPHHPKYPRFGAEGVQFAFASFQEFKNIVGERPAKNAQLKRICATGDYAPGNVVWREPVAA